MPKITIESKPRLFFPASHADESWRFKEKVVALIESYLQGLDDLYVFSPKTIANVVEDLAKVDAAYATISNPTELFEFVEVRDRAGTAGRDWVEQVMGRRTALGIEGATMVSTRRFSPSAIGLASDQNIKLRLLLPETDQNIKKWHRPDSIEVRKPLVEIVECRVVAGIGDRFAQFKADRVKSSEDNILVPTREPHRYRVVSLSRVFDVDVMLDQKRQDEFLAKVPKDNAFHLVVVGVEYEKPRLYLKVKELPSSVGSDRGNIFPIKAIAFVVRANRQFLNAPIAHRYKYLDAVSNQKIAEAIVAEATIEHQRYYICLVRHSWKGETFQLGGGFFR